MLSAFTHTDELRSEAKFRRDYDGHVWVQARSGEWWEVRLDAQVSRVVEGSAG